MSIAEKLVTIAENEQKVFEAGKRAEYDRFWDDFQQNGNKRNYRNAFFNWSADNYNPKYPIIMTSQANDVFYYCKMTDTKVDISTTTGMTRCFSACTELVTIRKLTVTENVTYSADCFNDCFKLENITFEGIIGQDISFADSPLLSKASIENIFSVLSSTVKGKILTLNLAAVTTAFGGTDSQEWLDLIATHSNWTANLSE